MMQQALQSFVNWQNNLKNMGAQSSLFCYNEIMSEKSKNTLKVDRGFQFNVSIFLILIIVMYVFFHVFSSATKKEIIAYEVALGTIVEKNFYQGMAIREEEIIKTDREGSIYYYGNNRSRVGVKSKIYAIDVNGNIIDRMRERAKNFRSLTGEELSGLTPRIESFLGGFDGVSFQNTYGFKSDVSDYLSDVLVKDLEGDFRQDIENAVSAGSYYEYRAVKPGLLCYNTDGYEDKTVENFTAEDFNSGGLSMANLRTRERVYQGNPAYKLVTSDDWKLIIPVDEKKAIELSKLNNINVRFTQDNVKTWASSEVIKKDEGDYLVLSFDDSMERYANLRFINVELLLDEKQGLKIPNSSLCEKQFYVVPKEYFYYGGNSNDLGVMVRRGGMQDEFKIPTIYYETERAYYIDSEYVKAGDKLLMEGSNGSYTVGADTDSLIGCYNINKGYAVFKAVDIIYKNEDYTIVRNRANYSIALYDHIVLDSRSVKENEII